MTLNGKPLEGAVVTFEPDASVKDGIPANDVTGPDGNYRAFTKGRVGIMPGKYHVLVTKSLIDTAKIRPEFKDDPFMAQLSLGPPERAKDQRKKEQIEGTFDREVPPEGGEQSFDLKSKSGT